MPQVFTQSVQIQATAKTVERCFTDLTLMHRWLNPVLLCQPEDEVWNTELGSRSRFIIRTPLLKPTLYNVVVEREPGLIVWEFQGFFHGRDRWEFQSIEIGTNLINRFEFDIPNPLVGWGFNLFAASWTQSDMRTQLSRIKQIAEGLRNDYS